MTLHPFDSCFPLLCDASTLTASDVPGILSRILHIASAIILGGGIFYLKTVLSPAGVDACYAQRREVWARWVHVAIVLLLVSGFFNFFTIIGRAKAAGTPLPPTYHALFGIKFLLGLLVMFVASILAGRTSAAEKFRAHMAKWLQIGWLAVLAIVAIGAVLRTFH